uniref:Uncharacterized protein n=1 Tax=Octopus bimaculoides TaxID=37653 RepID=A0A0L8GK99_OCTBM
MLGICTAPKENLNTFSTEIVYGTPLTVPGELLPNMKSDLDVKRYLTQLRDNVGQLHPIPMSTHNTSRSSMPNDLCMANFVFIQHDTMKTFPVTLQWLKLAYLNTDSTIQVAQPPNRGYPRQITPMLDKEQSPKSQVTTYMGRTIKTPSQFQ